MLTKYIIATFVALLLADYDVVIHHILKPPERQKISRMINF